MSLREMYSSKVKVISSLSKNVVLSFGEALIKTGGKLSLGPPVGEARLAQPFVERNKLPKIKKVSRTAFFTWYKFLTK